VSVISGCILTKFYSTMLQQTWCFCNITCSLVVFSSTPDTGDMKAILRSRVYLLIFMITRNKSVSQCCSIRRPERQCTALASEMMRLWNELSVAVHQLFEFSLPDLILGATFSKLLRKILGRFLILGQSLTMSGKTLTGHSFYLLIYDLTTMSPDNIQHDTKNKSVNYIYYCVIIS